MRTTTAPSGTEGWRAALRFVPLLVVAVFAAAPAATAQAESAARSSGSEEVARRAIGELRSPYCPGLMLEVCPSREAEALRDSIRMLAAAGMGSSELIEWMIAGHGEEWRATPKRRGAGLGAWLLPPAALLFGAGFLVFRLRSLRAASSDPELPPGELSDEEQAKLASALAELERAEEEVA